MGRLTRRGRARASRTATIPAASHGEGKDRALTAGNGQAPVARTNMALAQVISGGRNAVSGRGRGTSNRRCRQGNKAR